LQIDVVYDSSVAAAPAAFKACVNAVCQFYETLFTNPVTVTIDVGFGESDGQTLAATNLGQSNYRYVGVSYAVALSGLQAAAAPGSQNLPATAPVFASIELTVAQAYALGVLGNVTFGGPTGYVGFSSVNSFFYDPTQSLPVPKGEYDFMGTVEHEISEVMGRTSFYNLSGTYGVLDLYRYAAPGVLQTGSGNPAYFSIDGGSTDLRDFNNFQTGDKGDLGDWSPNLHSADAYNDKSASAVINSVGAVDKTVMAAIGWSESANAASLTPAAAVPHLGAAAAVIDVLSGTASYVAIADSAANVAQNLDSLQGLAANMNIASLALTDAGVPTLSLGAAQLANDQAALADISGTYRIAVVDSASNVGANLGAIETYALSGVLTGATLTDGGFPELGVTPAQLAADGAALAAISSNYTLVIAATTANVTASGIAGHGAVFFRNGFSVNYSVTGAGDGTSFTLSTAGSVDHLSDITAIEFADLTDIVANKTSIVAGGVTSFQVSALYAAVFDREPDVPGLAFYENVAATNPKLPIVTYAEYFLQSPEYTGNAAHTYAQTAAGDAQFITDTYDNLLHRAPETGAVAFYQTNVIDPLLTGLTPGTSAYANAELLAHATVLAYFSQSAEFQSDVQVTAQNPSSAQHWLLLI
jgi:hypothetical protein